MLAGTLLGLVTYAAGHERRYITAVNIALCFPELDAEARHALVRRSFIDNGIGLIETATGWMRKAGHFQQQLTLTGAEHLDAALATGRGVLLLGAHYSTLDFGANLLAVNYPFAVTYRPHKNPLFDAFMLRGRLSNCNGVFDRNDIRGMFRHLKQNKILWYAPDQDYGPEGAVYVPFFGHRAATLTAASRFAGFNKSNVVLVRQHRDTARKHYTLEFTSLTPPLPSGDDEFDAATINAAVEHAIRQEPSQYLWMHKRFKTQPGGKPESPYIHVKTPDKKLSEAQYAGMLDGATPHAATGLRLMTSGLLLREFAGVPGRWLKDGHSAWRFDRVSKQLRAHGIATATVDNIFRVKSRALTAVTLFMPAAEPLQPGSLSVLQGTTLLAQLHNNGFHFADSEPRILVTPTGQPVIANPLQVRQAPGSAAFAQRLADLRSWARLAQGSASTLPVLLENYLPLVRRADAAGFREWLARQPRVADNAPELSRGAR
jgi:KDO2-lipid IV(A) lauroyltransferase